jgi:hypothetical protein
VAEHVTTQEAGSRGHEAERRVYEHLRTALDTSWRLYPNARWLGRTALARPLRDGEADLVIADPEHGILVLEVKSGPVSRDAYGRWWSGEKQHVPGPFEQAETNKHALIDKLASLPGWRAGVEPLAGHAVAFPDVELASAGHGSRLLGPDVDARLILDRDALRTPESVRAWVAGAFAAWEDGQHRRVPLGPDGIALLDELLAPVTELRSLLRGDVADAEPTVVALTQQQCRVLDGLRSSRRQEILGCAGSGKTLLAAEKARRLAHEGYRTLLVCFNQPLARELLDRLARDIVETGRLEVSTFHSLCERLASEAGVLPHPGAYDQPWFEDTLPAALDAAIPLVGDRYHAVVVDEGQDFAAGWLESLQLLLSDPSDVFYVFHDPAQAIYRPDVVPSLELPRYELFEDCRSAGPIHALAARFDTSDLATVALRPEGRSPELIEAEPGHPTLEALRKLLHRLVVEEGLRPWEIAVLTGVALHHSDAWHERVFGNQVLWNGHVDEDGTVLGLAADAVPEQPTDVILCDTVHRSKGLDWPCIVLVELRADDPRLEQLLYVGISRARHHVVVIGRHEILGRLAD